MKRLLVFIFEKVENPKMFGSHRLYNGCTHFHMQIRFNKTFQMHLHMSPTCFEETRGRKIGFRSPGFGIYSGT